MKNVSVSMHRTFATVALLFFVVAPRLAAQQKNVCVECHANLQGKMKIPVEDVASSVHGHKGMSCETCHGGNPADAAHAKSAGSGFRDIKRADIPQLCGSCHADANRMKQFNPSLRTDQLAQYHTSVHGMKFSKGDAHVAVCTDCHGVHDIRPASDPRSTVHALNVATTCSRCHSDAELMKTYGISSKQYADYSDSVHHAAMVERGDLSAPTCSTCHGSHGAVPPGAGSVANVCSTCHVLQAQAFEESPHKAAFADGCATCHGAHNIKRPDDNFVGLAAGSACGECHTADDDAGKAAAAIHDQLKDYEKTIAEATLVLDRAAHSGMDVADAQLEISQAMDFLTKARVRVHTAKLARVNAELNAGMKIAQRARNDGESALKERNSRRKALLVPVLAIAAVVLSLGAYIRELERKGDS